MSGSTPEEYQALHILTSCTHLFSISFLSYLIARRTPPVNKIRHWKHLTWGKVCMFFVLFDSWLFVVISGILLTGVQTTGDSIACSLAILSCILFQGSSKVLIYAFLVEKVYIVWSGGYKTPRLKTKVYKICAVVLLGYVVLDILFFLGRASHIRDDGVCVLGYKHFASISLVTYDLLQNCFFTVMFLWPLWRSHVMNPRLRAVAKRTLIGAVAGLTISAGNTIILVALGGTELAWVCMNSCVADVALNALILYWVSAGAPSDSVDHFTLPEINVTNLTVGNQWNTSAKLDPTFMTGSTSSQTASLSFNQAGYPTNTSETLNREFIGGTQQSCECGDQDPQYSIGKNTQGKETICFCEPINISAFYPQLRPGGHLRRGPLHPVEESTHENESAVIHPGVVQNLRRRRYSV